VKLGKRSGPCAEHHAAMLYFLIPYAVFPGTQCGGFTAHAKPLAKSSTRDEKPANGLAAQQAERSFIRGPSERILQNSTNEPGMSMKTKDRVEKSGSRRVEKSRSRGSNTTARSSGNLGAAVFTSRLLDFQNRTNEPGMSSAPQQRGLPVGGSPTQIAVGKSGS